MTTAKMKMGKIVEDLTLYPRNKINPYNVSQMRESLRAGQRLPVILVDQQNRCVDGIHRLRAMKAEYGANVVVSVHVKKYQDDSEFFCDAMEMNSRHGFQLTIWDRVKCLIQAQDMGIPLDSVSKSLSITTEKAESLLKRQSEEGVPLKCGMDHFSGKKMTSEQASFNNGDASGKMTLFHVNQLIKKIETGSIEDTENVHAGLKKLYGLIHVFLEEA